MATNKPTLEQFGDAVDLAAQSLQEMQVPFSLQSLRETALQLRGIHRSQEVSIGIDLDMAVLAVGGVISLFDATKKGVHTADTAVHSDITDGLLQAERHPYGRGLPLYGGGGVVGQIFGIPSPNGTDAVHGHSKWLDEQLKSAQSGLNIGVIPMTLSVYVLEQVQRREAGLKPLDTKTITRFPQYFALERNAFQNGFVSPYAKWDKKMGRLILGKSDTHPKPYIHYRSIVGLRATY